MKIVYRIISKLLRKIFLIIQHSLKYGISKFTFVILIGPLSVAVPGEVRGLHAAWKKYGKLPWRDVIQPTVDMTEKGFRIQLRLYEAAQKFRDVIEEDPGLRSAIMKFFFRPSFVTAIAGVFDIICLALSNIVLIFRDINAFFFIYIVHRYMNVSITV